VFSAKIELTQSELAPICARALALSSASDSMAVERSIGELFSALATRRCDAHATSRRAVGHLRATPSVSGSELGQRLRTTQSRVSREFHRDLGLTLVEYRARLRLMRFVDLVDSGLPLGAAALSADFGSYAQCHRVFHRALGCAPREYFAGARARVEAAIATNAPTG
jgi:transcriptional regulator GlxA family with amidase domain